MKKTALLILLFATAVSSRSQNVGIGLASPDAKLHVEGGLLVSAAYEKAVLPPGPDDNITMVNGQSLSMNGLDSVVRVYDPGGPGNNYNANLSAEFRNSLGTGGYEFIMESMDVGSGDSIIITSGSIQDTILAVGNANNITGRWMTSDSDFRLFFKSNNDISVGAGFSILIKRLYVKQGQMANFSGTGNNSFLFHPQTASLRAGNFSTSSLGNFSMAIGRGNIASGNTSVAIGNFATSSGTSSAAIGTSCEATATFSYALGTSARATALGALARGSRINSTGSFSTSIGLENTANGDYSFALGYYCSASNAHAVALGKNNIASGYAALAFGDAVNATGDYAIAAGRQTTASGNSSVAMGYNTSASSLAATALGYNTTASGSFATAIGYAASAGGTVAAAIGRNATASGDYSTAIGHYVSTSDEEGALVIGDYSTTTVMSSATPNSFRARFAGGYRFYTSSDLTTNALLSAGSNAWSTSSDKRLKENFLELDGEDFLQKIAAMKLTSWNYKQQDATKFRHYGPMAQDFYAAFGKDKYGTIGNDTTINQADFDGVNLVAIQALEKRTAQQEKQIESQQKRIEAYEAALDALKKEIAAMKKQKKSDK